MKIKKNMQSMYQKNVVKKKHVDLLLIGQGEKTLCSYQRVTNNPKIIKIKLFIYK